MNRTVSFAKVRSRLALIWGVGFLLHFALFAVLSITTFQNHLLEAWGWFSATTLPTLGVILGSTLVRDKRSPRSVAGSAAQVAAIASVFYLALVLLVSVAWAWTSAAPLDWYKTSAGLLAPVQGIVSGLIGRFLANRDPGAA